jgi:peptidoglycan/xylan/chitin deacetylase (PgdA/CDA1 family)/CheY-like chemotaxis protein
MSAPKTARVMLVEDHLSFRQSLALLLSREPDLEVVAQAGSLAQARQMLDTPLDVVVLDLSLPDGDGRELIGKLHRTVSILYMGSTAYGTRGQRWARWFRPGSWDARRIAFVVVVLAFVVGLFSLGAPLYCSPSSEGGYVRSASPVEAKTLPGPPHPQPPGKARPPAKAQTPEKARPPDEAQQADIQRIWAAAIAKDPSPDLATNGKIGTKGGRIALTFDDGPDPRTTPQILDTLREHHLKATFFVVGAQIKENPGLLRRIVDEGHTIGNHTYDHADLSALSPKQMRLELRSTQEAVDDALGHHYPMALMRPPYGEPYSLGSDALPVFQGVVRDQRLFPILWTIGTYDYLLGGHPQTIVRNVISQDEARLDHERDEVILLHDIHPQDAQALPGIIDHFERSGRRFVSVSELLADKYIGP